MNVTEITVEVFNSKDEIFKKFEKFNLKLTEKFTVHDYYFSKFDKEELKQMSYGNLIKNSFLLRYVMKNNNIPYLCYKNKNIDEHGNAISEEKVQCQVEDLEKTLKIFELANINCWNKLCQDVYCFKNQKLDIIVQIVENLGIFIEYEEDETMQGLNEYEKIELMKNNLQELDLKFGDDYSCKKVYMKFKKEI